MSETTLAYRRFVDIQSTQGGLIGQRTALTEPDKYEL